MSDEMKELLEPITLNWRESELRRWVEDYSVDRNGLWEFYWFRDRLHINLCNQATICFVGERLAGGGICLAPYPDDPARYSLAAVADLRQLRDALSNQS